MAFSSASWLLADFLLQSLDRDSGPAVPTARACEMTASLIPNEAREGQYGQILKTKRQVLLNIWYRVTKKKQSLKSTGAIPFTQEIQSAANAISSGRPSPPSFPCAPAAPLAAGAWQALCHLGQSKLGHWVLLLSPHPKREWVWGAVFCLIVNEP